MSVRVTAKVWNGSVLDGTDLLMLLALADFSDDSGFSHPGVTSLAKKCRTTPRTANRLLARLVKSGELEIRRGEGPPVLGGRLNRYRIRLDVLTAREGVTLASSLSDDDGVDKMPEGVTSASGRLGATSASGVTSMTERGDIHDRKG